jgi:hypothetical protein
MTTHGTIVSATPACSSLQAAKNVNSAVVMSPGTATGSITRRSAPSVPHPSIRAASSRLDGIAANELRIRNRPNGSWNVV